jgi:hypothetical protein
MADAAKAAQDQIQDAMSDLGLTGGN